MDVISATLFKLALKGEISETELKVLNGLHEREQDFLELSESTGLELMELKETLKEFEKKNLIKQEGGKYFFNALEALNQMVSETETVKELA
ncbi:MAG: hypothetical protein AABW85_01360 [archaeon]